MSGRNVAQEGDGAHRLRDALLAALLAVAIVAAYGLAGNSDLESEARYQAAMAEVGSCAR